jgi:hypothetical protein
LEKPLHSASIATVSLSFVGPGGSVERRWIVYALLRDNVQHYLEGGTISGRYAAIHGMAAALGGSPVRILASELCRELERARALMARPVEELALSGRTVAVISHQWPLPEGSATKLVGEWPRLPQLAPGAKTLGDVLGPFVEELLGVCAGGDAKAVVEVRDQ